MSSHVEEVFHSPQLVFGTNPSADRTLRVFDDDASLTLAGAKALAAAWLTAHPLSDVSASLRLKSLAPTQLDAPGAFEFVAHYDRRAAKIVKFSMDYGGTKARRYFLPVDHSAAAPGENAPDFGGGIGWSGDHFEGIDVDVPGGRLSIEMCVPWESMTVSYRNSLYSKRGCVNSGAFFGFEKHAVKFDGGHISNEEEVDAAGTPTQFWRVTLNFLLGLNMKNVTCNGKLSPIDVDAWQPYWVFTVTVPDASGKYKIKKPIAHYTHTIEEYDFSSSGVPQDLYGPLWRVTEDV